jgi:hypothetical protein
MSIARLKVLKQDRKYNSPVAYMLTGKHLKILVDAIEETQASALLDPIKTNRNYNGTLDVSLSGIDVKRILDSIVCPADNLWVIRNKLRFNTKHEFILTGKDVKAIVDSIEDVSCVIPPGPVGDALVLTYNDVTLITEVADYTALADWNTFFSSDFTDLVVNTDANTISLYGGTSGAISASSYANNFNIVSVVDNLNIIGNVGASAFSTAVSLSEVILNAATGIDQFAFEACASLATISFTSCITIGIQGFTGCTSIPKFEFPALDTMDVAAFQGCTAVTELTFPVLTAFGPTVGVDDSVFSGIIGNTIQLTIPAALVGEPEVTQLEADNTVTIVPV